MHFSVTSHCQPLFPPVCLVGLGFFWGFGSFFGLISPLCARISSLARPPHRAQCVVLEVDAPRGCCAHSGSEHHPGPSIFPSPIGKQTRRNNCPTLVIRGRCGGTQPPFPPHCWAWAPAGSKPAAVRMQNKFLHKRCTVRSAQYLFWVFFGVWVYFFPY